MTISQIYFICKKNLNSSEANQILESVLNLSHHELIINRDKSISKHEEDTIYRIIDERKKFKPIQYIFEKCKFMGLEFKVGEGVLIPRTDTEVLVSESIKILKNIKSPRILELCSGSGIIPITISKKIKNSHIVSVEKSRTAAQFFKENIKLNGCENIDLVIDNVLSPQIRYKEQSFDFLISNPPYIASKKLLYLQEEVKREPKMALDGGEDGLAFYRAIIKNFLYCLKNTAFIAFEIDHDQAKSVTEILKKTERFENIYSLKDINGLDRAIFAQSKIN